MEEMSNERKCVRRCSWLVEHVERVPKTLRYIVGEGTAMVVVVAVAAFERKIRKIGWIQMRFCHSGWPRILGVVRHFCPS